MNDELTQEPTQDVAPSEATPQKPQDQAPVDAASTEPTEPQPEDKLKNDLQAWMGRKLKEGLEERDERLFGKIADLLNTQQQPAFQQQQPQQPYVDTDPEPDPDVDVRAWYDWRKRQDIQQEQQAIQFSDNAYFQTLNDPNIKHPEEKVHKAILEHMQQNQGHNQTIAGPIS